MIGEVIPKVGTDLTWDLRRSDREIINGLHDDGEVDEDDNITSTENAIGGLGTS